MEEYKDLSRVKPSMIKAEEKPNFFYGYKDRLIIQYDGKKIAEFYYNLKGYNQNFWLKNKDKVRFNLGGDRSKTEQKKLLSQP